MPVKAKKLTAFSSPKNIKMLSLKLRLLRCRDIHTTFLEYENIFEGKTYDELEIELHRTREAISELFGVLQRTNTDTLTDLDAFVADKRYVDAISDIDSIFALISEIKELDAEEEKIKALYSELLPFEEYPHPLGLAETKNTNIILSSIVTRVRENSEEKDRAELISLGKTVEPFYATLEQIKRHKNKRYMLSVCHKCDTEAVKKALVDAGFELISFPSDYEKATVIMQRLNGEMRENRQKHGDAMKKLEMIFERSSDLLALEDLEAQALIEAGDTVYTAMIEAWVSEAREERLEEMMLKCGAAYMLRDPKDYENPPVFNDIKLFPQASDKNENNDESEGDGE